MKLETKATLSQWIYSENVFPTQLDLNPIEEFGNFKIFFLFEDSSNDDFFD